MPRPRPRPGLARCSRALARCAAAPPACTARYAARAARSARCAPSRPPPPRAARRSLAADLHELGPDQGVALGHVHEVGGRGGLRGRGQIGCAAPNRRARAPRRRPIAPTLSGQLSTTRDDAMAPVCAPSGARHRQVRGREGGKGVEGAVKESGRRPQRARSRSREEKAGGRRTRVNADRVCASRPAWPVVNLEVDTGNTMRTPMR
jgi:hypothetical protein